MALFSGCVGKWKLANTTYTDSGNANDLTATGSPTATTGHGSGANLAANFAGSQYLKITDAAQTGLDPTAGLTISLWLYTGTDQTAGLVSKLGNGAGNYQYDMYITGASPNREVYLRVSSNGTALTQLASASKLANSTWYHIVGTYDGVKLRVYLNSAENSSVAYTSGIFAGTGGSPSPFWIGADSDDVAYSYTGRLQDVAIWERPLSASEIVTLYGLGDGFPESYTTPTWSGYFSDNFEDVNQVVNDTNPASFAELMALMPPVKYSGNPIITHDATYTNYFPTGWLIDPLDSTKFLLYIGEYQGISGVGSRFSLYTGTRTDPFTVSRYGVVLTLGAAGQWDDNSSGPGSVIDIGGTVYFYYMGAGGDGIAKIGLATSTDGGRTFTKHASNPILSPTGSETGITDPAVIFDGSSTYYMYYTATLAGSITQIHIAHSSDGISWTKDATVALANSTVSTDYDSGSVQNPSVIKVGSDIVLFYSAIVGAGPGGAGYISTAVATSTSWVSAFTKYSGNPVDQHSLTGWDSVSVACAYLVNNTGNEWCMYYQGEADIAGTIWDVGGTSFTGNVESTPTGYLVPRNLWTGAYGWAEYSAEYVIAGVRSLKLFPNNSPPAFPIQVSHDVDVTPGSASVISFKIRSDTVTVSGKEVSSFEVMENANIITRVRIYGGNLELLTTRGAWVALQAVAINTTYSVEIFLRSATQMDVYVDSVLRSSLSTYYTTISTKANRVNINKMTATAAKIYFDSVVATDNAPLVPSYSKQFLWAGLTAGAVH